MTYCNHVVFSILRILHLQHFVALQDQVQVILKLVQAFLH